jgi:allantoin racemase
LIIRKFSCHTLEIEFMKIALVNPNTSASMTKAILAAGQMVAGPGIHLVASNPTVGPSSIQGPYDGALAVPPLLDEIAAAESGGADAAIVACFDDTGLAAARHAANIPIVGIGEAAFHVGAMIAHRFSVVTTVRESVPVIENNLLVYGLASRCAKVRACGVPVLELDGPGSRAADAIGAEIERAKANDAIDAIILGCAGMANLAAELSAQHQLPVIEGVRAAVKMAEALVVLGGVAAGSVHAGRGLNARPLLELGARG